MSTRYKTHARSAMSRTGSEIYIAAMIYLAIPFVFSRVITFNISLPISAMMASPDVILEELAHLLTPAQILYLSVGSLIVKIINSLLNYGFTFYTLKVSRYEGAKYNDIFAGFYNIGRVILADIFVWLRTLGWAMITFVPIFAVGIFLTVFSISDPTAAGLSAAFFTLLALLPLIFICVRYEQTTRVLVDDPEISAWQAVNASAEIMKGHALELIGLRLSFILWSLLESYTRGITGVYSQPYLYCAEAAFYDDISSVYFKKERLSRGEEDNSYRESRDFDSLR